ncbi:MAG TPA: SCO family protein [Geminicoccaceae bacterium]|nr:SCO family protein [Geminicoccaceae bacterium]
MRIRSLIGLAAGALVGGRAGGARAGGREGSAAPRHRRPERDTPQVLKEYPTAFDPRILGLTGTPAQVEQALRSFRVYASKRPLEGGDYTMDHSAFIYLMDPAGHYAAQLSPQEPVERMAGKIRTTVDAGA